VPHLAAVIVGNDGASLTYVGSKVKACERRGFRIDTCQNAKYNFGNRIAQKNQTTQRRQQYRWVYCPVAAARTNRYAKSFMAIDPSKDVDGFILKTSEKWH
jgi:methylenetetrahydrofolate dehydrogenase (NADP+)/methenyltetrahydrofolate cyclohydrolase